MSSRNSIGPLLAGRPRASPSPPTHSPARDPTCAPTRPPLLQIILAIVFATQLADVKGASVSQVRGWLAQGAGGERLSSRGSGLAALVGGAFCHPPPPAPAVHGCRSIVCTTQVHGGGPGCPLLLLPVQLSTAAAPAAAAAAQQEGPLPPLPLPRPATLTARLAPFPAPLLPPDRRGRPPSLLLPRPVTSGALTPSTTLGFDPASPPCAGGCDRCPCCRPIQPATPSPLPCPPPCLRCRRMRPPSLLPPCTPTPWSLTPSTPPSTPASCARPRMPGAGWSPGTRCLWGRRPTSSDCSLGWSRLWG